MNHRSINIINLNIWAIKEKKEPPFTRCSPQVRPGPIKASHCILPLPRITQSEKYVSLLVPEDYQNIRLPTGWEDTSFEAFTSPKRAAQRPGAPRLPDMPNSIAACRLPRSTLPPAPVRWIPTYRWRAPPDEILWNSPASPTFFLTWPRNVDMVCHTPQSIKQFPNHLGVRG